MVCKKCEKKVSKLATTDPFQASSSKTRVIGENKLLSSKKKYNPYGRKCIECKSTVQQNQATRCQACAYKKGLCAICGVMILDTSRYKQSVA